MKTSPPVPPPSFPLLGSLLAFTLLPLVAPLAAAEGAAPVISEFMASNLDALDDEDGDASDWIEFFHPGDSVYDLAGHFLTDDARNLRKWKFPGSLKLDPGGYGLVFASGKERGGLFAKTFHTNFELSSDGEYLALVAPDGETVLSELAPRYPKQRTGLSYGVGSQEDWQYFTAPTPGDPNGEGLAQLPPRVADTKFNFTRGFYDEPIEVTITTATEDARIYYSVDGSDPGPGSVFKPGKLYEGPLQVNSTTLLRARAYKDGLEPTNIDTHTYLFLSDILTQSDDQPGLPDRWNGQPADYGMDPDIVDSPQYRDRIRQAFLSIPTLSLVTGQDNIWGSQGLYLNTTRNAPDGSGADFDYEFEVSAEWLNPDGNEGFQIQAGWRAQGGASRNADRSPKHAMSLRFRREYGAGRLEYPVLKDSPQKSFNSLHLRARYNNSWIHSAGDQRQRAQLMRDQWARDSLIAMGNPAAGHGNYVHLYLNGLYWGIYNLHERLDASHYADYFGGRSDTVDAINGGRVTSGDLQSYNAMRNAARARDWDAIRQRLDVDNYIDWQIIQRFASNRDLKNDGNWKAAGGGSSDALWRYFAWDTERILEGLRDGQPTPSADPTGIFSDLQQIPEFVQRFGDRLQKHLFHGGALTPASNQERLRKRARELDMAIIAESARWGDYRRNTPYERDVEWLEEQERLLQDYFPLRTEEVIAQYRKEGLYPNILGVDLNPAGGEVPAGTTLELTSEAVSIFNPGTLYYTTDGSDPQGPDGQPSATAVAYETPVPLDSSVTVKARVRSSRGEWSALTESFFAVGTHPADAGSLVISELMYHPGPPTAEESAVGHVDSDAFEFIELLNIGTQPLNLAGVHFAAGIDFRFPAGPSSILSPGQRSLLVRDLDAFRYRYPNAPETAVVGMYRGSLANGGEDLRLVAANGDAILTFAYSDGGSWPLTTDGGGFSLEATPPLGTSDPTKGDSWTASADRGGSPGLAPSDTPGFNVVINEVLTHPLAPSTDAIELYNAGSTPVDVSHWFLTDDAAEPQKFALPSGSIIEPGGFLVLYHDNDTDPSNNDTLPETFFGRAFALSSQGEEAYLFSADAEGRLTGYSNGFSFGAAAPGVSFGRVVDSQGRVHYPPQSAPTLGLTNADPALGEVVFSEIMYHSADTDQDDRGEFLELASRTEAPVDLSHWRIEGLGFALPENTLLPAGETLLIVRATVEAFREAHAIPGSVQILGPYDGRLNNDGERLTLQRPATFADPDGSERHVWITVDSVRYNDAAPWPLEADGAGRSLIRTPLASYGDEVTHWTASPEDGGSPGSLEDDGGSGPEPVPFSQWRLSHFTAPEAQDDSVSGPLADPDDDGFPNQLEYALGTLPKSPDPFLTAVRLRHDTVQFTFPQNRLLTGVVLQVQWSSDLQTWSDVKPTEIERLETVRDEAVKIVTLSVTSLKNLRFLRVSVNEG